LLLQDEGDPYSLRTTPDGDDVIPSASSTPITPFTALSSTASSSKVKVEATSKTPSRASTPKSRTLLKRTLQDAFAEGSAKENQILERLGTQKHERAIGELELKRRKLENKAMEKQHQREQHEFRMMQMRMMMTQNQQTAPVMTQSRPHNQALFDGFGFMPGLDGAALSSESPSLSPFSV
jgi:flagellar biosynthesis GTPase FlhF